jgi:7-cyano-7-deazaguanine reductase
MSNPLGKTIPFSNEFDPNLLFPIERAEARVRLGVKGTLPFHGSDRWTCYELSWLNLDGVPQLGIATISYPADTPCLVESKSLKLFLGSMNFAKYADHKDVESAVRAELIRVLKNDDVAVAIVLPESWRDIAIRAPLGESIDNYPINREASVQLRADSEVVSETLHSDLLRSLCPVTSQPDWGTVMIRYRGKKLDRISLMTYLTAHRSYQGFHEECCERIFLDIQAACSPDELWVGCFYTRRGGLDINPERWLPGTIRPSFSGRLARQ